MCLANYARQELGGIDRLFLRDSIEFEFKILRPEFAYDHRATAELSSNHAITEIRRQCSRPCYQPFGIVLWTERFLPRCCSFHCFFDVDQAVGLADPKQDRISETSQ